MTVRHSKYVNEDEKIVEVDGYNVTNPNSAIACLKRELRVIQAMWPDDLAGYKIVKRAVKK